MWKPRALLDSVQPELEALFLQKKIEYLISQAHCSQLQSSSKYIPSILPKAIKSYHPGRHRYPSSTLNNSPIDGFLLSLAAHDCRHRPNPETLQDESVW